MILKLATFLSFVYVGQILSQYSANNPTPYNLLKEKNFFQITSTPSIPSPLVTSGPYIWKNPTKLGVSLKVKTCLFSLITKATMWVSNVLYLFIDYRGVKSAFQPEKCGIVNFSGLADMIEPKFGDQITITMKPLVNNSSIILTNLFIQNSAKAYDCFSDCPSYFQNKETGCNQPICKEDPCQYLSCDKGLVCSLMRKGKTFPSLPEFYSSGFQLWGCLKPGDENGCKCENFSKGEGGCPSCPCI